MRYKALINGKNAALVKDFIRYTDYYFKGLSTTDLWNDVIYHFELFQPEVYICFVDSDYRETLDQINKLKSHYLYNSAAIVLIGNLDICATIKRNTPYAADLVIKRPASPDNMALKIVRYLEEKAAEANSGSKKGNEEIQESFEEENVKKHLLIVDDDRTILKMLRAALEDKYEITTMVNGVLVERLIETKKIDLIILDYEMPVETGAEVFKKIKLNEKAKKIPVCFLTGITDHDKIEEILSLKPHGYMLKPINMDMLLTTISNLT